VNRGWWRRNRWGLILVLPLVAGVFGLNGHLIYVRNYAQLPKEPVPVDATGKASLDDFTVRVIELAPVENQQELKRLLPFDSPSLPSSVKVWRLILSVDGPDTEPAKSDLVDCLVSLRDDATGRSYAMGPSELSGAEVRSFGGCLADDDEQPAPFTSTTFFLLPAETRPSAIVVTWRTRLPRFVRFPVP
jgi:hypothetical protein